jgi:hypothetical protein
VVEAAEADSVAVALAEVEASAEAVTEDMDITDLTASDSLDLEAVCFQSS